MNSKDYYNEAIKNVLVDMAIDCSLPEDMNDLCMDTMAEKAELKLKDNFDYYVVQMTDELSRYIGADDGDFRKPLEKLMEQGGLDGSEMADSIVSMCERYEYSFTVYDLLNSIGHSQEKYNILKSFKEQGYVLQPKM